MLRSAVASVVALAWLVPFIPGQPDKGAPMPPLTLLLQPVETTVAAGSVPAFRLTIRNDGKEPQKVLRLHGDLQDTYYDLEITRAGQRVEVSRAISDPGLVGAD